MVHKRGPNEQHNKKHANVRQTEPGLVTFTTSSQEMERIYSYNPGAHTGQLLAIITTVLTVNSITTRQLS